MNGHLSARQIDEWIIGQRSPELEEHLLLCTACADEVERVAGPLRLFGDAVRSWGQEKLPARAWVPAASRGGMWPRSLVWVVAAILMIVALPVYRRVEMKRQAAVVTAQDEVLLRQVQAGISRSVPAPMEPLARLMSNDLNR